MTTEFNLSEKIICRYCNAIFFVDIKDERFISFVKQNLNLGCPYCRHTAIKIDKLAGDKLIKEGGGN